MSKRQRKPAGDSKKIGSKLLKEGLDPSEFVMHFLAYWGGFGSKLDRSYLSASLQAGLRAKALDDGFKGSPLLPVVEVRPDNTILCHVVNCGKQAVDVPSQLHIDPLKASFEVSGPGEASVRTVQVNLQLTGQNRRLRPYDGANFDCATWELPNGGEVSPDRVREGAVHFALKFGRDSELFWEICEISLVPSGRGPDVSSLA